MRISSVSTMIVLMSSILVLAGCATPSSSPDSSTSGSHMSGHTMTDDEMFEHNHGEDMQKKSDQEQAMSGKTISTIDLLTPSTKVAISSQDVSYATGSTGFLAYPTDQPDAPGIVIIHERRGLNDHIKDMARVLAMNGYRVLAVDLYNGQVATTSEQAMGLSRGIIQTEATANLLAAEQFLRITSPKVASLGRCLGGKQSLELSLASDTLDATVIYYGRLYDDPAVLSQVNQPLLGIFAENDQGIPPSAVQAFQSGLQQAGKSDVDITIYPGVDHAFANPTGDNYSQKETLDAWNKTLAFLQKHL